MRGQMRGRMRECNIYKRNRVSLTKVNVKTTEAIGMGLLPFDAEFSVDGYKLLIFWISSTICHFSYDLLLHTFFPAKKNKRLSFFIHLFLIRFSFVFIT
uniref:Uncharacterized protein n=1 Tax=Bracoviriform glomeratae TaxID=257816 RepID=Q6S368_9VIRU|nr:hypothetical protein 6 [Bracoviriform glomeratae]